MASISAPIRRLIERARRAGHAPWARRAHLAGTARRVRRALGAQGAQRAGRVLRWRRTGRRVVVGVALFDGGGRVLAARRRAGGWEFPGGKVEPGESERAAAARECAEELGVRVVVTGRLPGWQPCGHGYRLRIWAGRVVEGEPEPREHAELRRTRRTELAGLAWLPADVPFLSEIARRL